MMRRVVTKAIFAAGLLAAATAAHGADIPRYKAPVYVGPSAATWTGFYIGLNAGYGFGKSDWSAPASSPSPKGFLVGPTLGYNWQFNNFVFGVEGDYDFSTMKGSAPCGAATCETSNTYLATLRGRLGYAAFSNFLFYLTGGGAYGNIKAVNSLAGNASNSKLGYSIGGGVEYALWSNWSVKAEYLYVDLGSFDCGISCGAAGSNVSFKANTVRAGINYRF